MPGAFGHTGHLRNKGGASAGAPIQPETAPEERPHFFYSAKWEDKKSKRYVEGMRADLKTPKDLKDLADKLLAAGGKGGMLNDALNHYTTAMEHLEYMHSINEPSELSYSKMYTLYHNRAMCNLEMGRYDAALEDAEFVIKSKPNWINGYLRKGSALFASRRFNDALSCYGEGMEKCGKYEEQLKEGKQAAQDMMMRVIGEGMDAFHHQGERVRLTGLKAREDLNGQHATVLEDPLGGGAVRPTVRVRVKLADGKELSVKSSNMESLPSDKGKVDGDGDGEKGARGEEVPAKRRKT